MQGEHSGNPFIFENVVNYLENGDIPKNRTKEEIRDVVLKHINMEIEEKGEYTGIREMRKHISWYTKGMQNGSYVRNYINTITNKEELIKAITEYFK